MSVAATVVGKRVSGNDFIAPTALEQSQLALQVADRGLESARFAEDAARHEIQANDTPVRMGLTEVRLLSYLLAHPDRVFTRTQLLDAVWGDHVFIEERTVDVHMLRLRKALAPAGVQHLVQTVRGLGYRLSQRNEG